MTGEALPEAGGGNKKDNKQDGSGGAGASGKKEGNTLGNQLVNLKEGKKMEDVREMSGEESEMKCLFIITCIFGGKSFNSLFHIYSSY